jgi:hypothetical protein
VMRAISAWVRGAATVMVLCGVTACSDGGDGGLAAFGIDDGASRGVSKSAEVSAVKGAHIALSTGAALDVPMGAVDKSVKLTMERPADGKAIDLVERFKKDQDRIVSAPYVLTPHGTKFKEDVSVTLPVSKTGDRELSVAWLEEENDSEWKLLSVAKSDGKTAEVKLKHFSVLVVIEDASDLAPVPELPDDRPDASTSEPGADAGAGMDRPDAGAGVDRDAYVEVDAGDELPAEPDAGVRDAGMMPALDAGTGVGDGSTSLPEAGVAQSQLETLESCGLVLSPGKFSESGFGGHPEDTLFSYCVHSCFNGASCMDAQIYRCDTDGQVSLEVSTCLATCQQPIDYCPENPSFPVLRCDGTADCADGRDELGCDPARLFDCGDGTRLAHTRRCDGTPDCPSSADESGCFLCDGDSSTIPPFQVCDGVPDCNDGADEQGCAEISCGIITQ